VKLADVIQRIEAWRRGAPVPLGETLPWPRVAPADRLVVVFVRMAGEARPWGVAAGHPGEEPAILTVPEPRDAGELARLALGFAAILLPHLPHPEHASEAEKLELAALAARRQLWMPGPTHVEMLHFLDYRFSRASARDEAYAKDLGALGRASGWLFRESTRPGQMRVLDATTRLREAFAVPAEDVRQAHLGFLLAWLEGAGSREDRVEAARVAEGQTVGVTMSPDLERDQLEDLVRRWNAARGDADAAAPIAEEIHAVLAPELLRRFRLVEQSIRALEDARPPNPGLDEVSKLAAEEHLHQYWNTEVKAAAPVTDPDAPRFLGGHPETDFLPTQAAARFFAHAHAAEITAAELVHGDAHLVRTAIEAGNAVAGTITRVTNEGSKRSSTPVWTVVAPAEGALRLREDSSVCVIGMRKRTGRVRSIVTDAGAGARTFQVEIDGWKMARPKEGICAADAPSLEGTEVVLVDSGVVGISKRKSMKVWDASGPGAWLTHAAPPPEPGAHPPVEGDLVALVEKLGGA
jgi:hypothetical protein